jgi:hypothetical protein
VKRFRWEAPAERSIPKHPYRDSAVLYGVFACILVGVTALTGGNVRASAIIAPALFVVATGYSWWRWRTRIREGAAKR